MCPKDSIDELRKELESWEETRLKKERETKGEWKKEFKTASGIPVKTLYTPTDSEERGWSYSEKLGFPGKYPFTRGITPMMYRNNIYIMSQYGGFGTAEETNRHIKYVISKGGTGYGIAQDLPTQVGLDSDHPFARGEVGKVGVAIDSLADVETIFDGIPVENVEIYTTSNATGPIFLAFLLALCEKRNVSPKKLKVSIQNEILKEFVSRGTYIFPPKPSLNLSGDLIEYCLKNGLKNIQPIWFCGYHMREAGGNIIQELAFTLANAVAYLDNVASRGVDLNHFNQPAVAFTAGMDLFEEVCKHRAFRRMWAKLMKDRYRVTAEPAMSVFFRDHTAAHQLTEQQPLNNIVRSTVAGLVQALSGNQVMSLASYDEAYAIPSPETLKVSLRTQQIIAYETGVVNTVDPLAGSYYVEWLTDEIEDKVTKLFERVQSMGGAVHAIEQGFMTTEIGKSAYQQLKEIESGERVVVGLNRYQEDEEVHLQLFKGDPEVEEKEIKKVQKLKRERDAEKVRSTLKQLGEAAREGVNLVEPLVPAVRAYATLGEICSTLKEVFGEHKEAAY